MTNIEQTQSVAKSLIVEGGLVLRGSAAISGFKHSFVTSLAAGIAAGVETTLSNVPDIAEPAKLATLLRLLGARVTRGAGFFVCDPRSLNSGYMDPGLAGAIHGASYMVPGILRQHGSVSVMTNGGCQIGSTGGGQRPFRHYADVFEKFGAIVRTYSDGRLDITSDGLIPCSLDMTRYISKDSQTTDNLYSGATKMALLCAATANGTSVITNYYSKPDVEELISVLNATGIISYHDSNRIVIEGSTKQVPASIAHEIGPDLIEVMTWITIGALLADGEFKLVGRCLDKALHGLNHELKALEKIGIKVDLKGDSLIVTRKPLLESFNIIVNHQDSIFSDSHPFFSVIATHANGLSTITDNVWPDRRAYVPQLCRLGGKIAIENATVKIQGPCNFIATNDVLHAADLRAAAVLLICALKAPGQTKIENVAHLARGYPDLIGALRACGASIQCIDITSSVEA